MFKIFLLCTIFLKVFIESVTVLVLFCFVCFSPEACGISAPCCCCSVAKLCPTLCDPTDCSTSGQIVCQSGCTIFYSASNVWVVQFLSILVSIEYCHCFSILAILVSMWWCHIVVLICISLMPKNVERLLLWLFAIYITSSMNSSCLLPIFLKIEV